MPILKDKIIYAHYNISKNVFFMDMHACLLHFLAQQELQNENFFVFQIYLHHQSSFDYINDIHIALF